MIGCRSPTSPADHESNVSNSDNGSTLSVTLGDEIHVTLQTIGPGEYQELPDISSSAVALVTVTRPLPPNPAGPRQVFQFKAVARGRAVISIVHTSQNPRFGITVDVR